MITSADRDFDAAAQAFADRVLGQALPADAAALITQAGERRDRPAEALALLERAQALAPQHPVPVIALYRFHFYGHALEQARLQGESALALARAALGPDFGDEPPADDTVRGDAAVRFYLFTLKALAYLNLRLGERDEARLMLGELRRLDPQDHLGGGLLSHVMARHEAGGGTSPSADGPSGYPVRGWHPHWR